MFTVLQQMAITIGHGPWAGHPPIGQMPHQFQIKGQFLGTQFFKQREDKPALRRVDEIIGVFNARGNAFEGRQLAKIESG